MASSPSRKELLALLAQRDEQIAVLEAAQSPANAMAQENELFFSVALEMLCIAGFDGYFKRINPMWTRTLGWSDAELLARPFLDLVHPEDRDSTIAAASALADGSDVVCFDNRYACKDGSWRWLSWNSYPIVERQLIVAAARDVTDQRRTDERIRRLNEELEQRVSQQSQAILELSTPTVRLFDEIVLLPLVGVIDTLRARQLMEALLEAIVATKARVAILDVTGVPIIDTRVAQHLVNAVSAARMLGAETVLTGIGPEMAQTLVKLGIDLAALRTGGPLLRGIEKALALVGKRVVTVG